jgi:hypothetical protein
VQTVRVFVGRLELVTPATQKEVETALDAQDKTTLTKFGRFLEPILQTMIQKETDPARAAKLNGYLSSVLGQIVTLSLRGN